MHTFLKQSLYGWTGVALLLGLGCGGTSEVKDRHERTARVMNAAIKCQSPAYVVKLSLGIEEGVCDKEDRVCVDGLVQLHSTKEKDTYAFLLLDKKHRSQPNSLEFLDHVLSEAHNSNRPVVISYLPKEGKGCESSAPVLFEKEIVAIEIVK